MQYYEVVVQLTTESEDKKGNVKVKRQKEAYLVDAMSVTEAEARVVELFKHYSQDFQVIQVTQSRIVQVLEHEEKEQKAEVNVANG
jgi:hypothetical protein